MHDRPPGGHAGDALIGKDDGSTYDFACSFTDSGGQNTTGTFRTTTAVSGTITILKRPGD